MRAWFGTSEGRRHLLAAIGLALLYWAMAEYSRSLAILAGGRAYFWPADGLALGALLVTRRIWWPLYLLAVFAVNFGTSYATPAMALWHSVFNVLEPCLVALAIRALLGPAPRFNTVRATALQALAIMVVMAPLTMAVASVNTWYYAKDFWPAWGTWYVSDTLGMLIVAFLVVSIANEARIEWTTRWRDRLGEVLLAFACQAGATHLFFAVLPALQGGWLNLSSTPLLGPGFFLLWAALRFGLVAAALGILLLAAQTYWYTAHGFGPLANQYSIARFSLVHLQAVLLFAHLIAVLVAAGAVERRNANAKSEAARKRLEFAIVSGDMLVFEADIGRGRIAWSGDTVAVVGQKAADIGDLSVWLAAMHEDDRADVIAHQSALERGAVDSADFDFRVRFSPAHDWMSLGVSVYAMPSQDPGEPRHAVGFLKNVTALRRLEEERRLLEERLHQSEKMEAVGRLAGGIAHDFNNIIGAILGYAEMAQAEVAKGSELARYVDTIAGAGERGKALVAQILTFSRLNRVDAQPVEMVALVAEVCEVLRGSMAPGIRIQTDLPAAPLQARGNATHFYQLVMNLATNAIQAMPKGGTLRLALREIDNPVLRTLPVGVLQPGRYLVLDCVDEGEGIAADVLPRIFEPFFSTRSKERNTGLGLSIVHGVVVGHGGAIEVVSRQGEGTTFSVYLPMESHASAAARVHPAEAGGGNGEAVLVVDDDPALVKLAEDLLAQLGYEPLGFTVSREALDVFLAEPGRFDAVLTDEIMPGLCGSELCAALRAAGLDVPVVIATAYGGAGFDARAGKAGASGILAKPYRKAELAAAMSRAMASRASRVRQQA